jgi:methyl-accepting chemotaxis protein
MKQFGIRSKLLLSIGVLATGYLLFLGLVQWTAATTQRHLTTVSKAIYPAALSIEHAQAGFQKLTKDYKDSVLLQDKAALTAADQDAKQIVEQLSDVHEKAAFDPILQAQVATVLNSFEGLASRSKTAYSALVEHPDSPAADTQTTLAALSQDDHAMERSLFDLNEQIGSKAFGAELDAVDSSNARQRLLALGLFLVAVAFAVGTIFTMEKQVSAPLRELARRLADGARQVAASAQEVSDSGQSLAERASRQAASLEETSASSEEISSMAQRSADDCRSTAELVTMSQRKFDETNQSLKELLSAMDEINISSGKVSKIIKVIDEIAFQTNILALNAAVEAARAGEAGMGFAVVADEVRSLAQRCAKAAQDSTEIIAESIARSQQGKKKLDDVAVSIQAVTSESVKVKVYVDQINVASTEQTRGIGQIAKSISMMEKVTQGSAATAEESAAAAQELTVQSNLMNEIVSSLSLVVEGA